MGKKGKKNNASCSSNTQSVVCKWKKGQVSLEVLCHPSTIALYRSGKLTSIADVVLSDEIYSNANKFEKASASDVAKVTGGLEGVAAIDAILRNGEFPLTKHELTEMRDSKRAEIVNYLHRHYQDPRGDHIVPHPLSRIEGIIDTMKVKIDPHQPTEHQLKQIVKLLPQFLPVKPVFPT